MISAQLSRTVLVVVILLCLGLAAPCYRTQGSSSGFYVTIAGRTTAIFYNRNFKCLCLVWQDHGGSRYIPAAIILGAENRIQWPQDHAAMWR